MSATLSTHNVQTLFDPAGPLVLDNHPQDSRVTIREDGMSPTLTEKMGTGGGNVPMVMEPVINTDGVLIAMATQQSHAEIREDGIAPTITAAAGTSGNNQPVLCAEILQPIPIGDKATRYNGGGSDRRDDGSGNGLGIGAPGDPAPTLTANDRHGVAYGISRDFINQGENAQFSPEIIEECSTTLTASTNPPGVAMPVTIPDISGTLTAKMAKGTGGPAGDEMQNLVAEWPEYIVRRFTPLECGRLQGFPDWWTEELGIEEPAPGTIERWMEIFKTYWQLVTKQDGVKSPKTRNQVIKWLKDPTSDSSLYKMWGNGIALPCAMFVMEGIAEYHRKE